MKRQYIYALVALVVLAVVAGFIIWKKKKTVGVSTNGTTSALAQKHDKTIVLKKA